MMRFKVHNVDAVARTKGFRRNHTYVVRGFGLDANPERGPLLLVRNRAGEMEGFYPDQGRWVDRGQSLHRKLVRDYRTAQAMQAPAPWDFGTSTGHMTLPGVSENLPRGGATG